ncbi:MAG: phospho-N-acetylmuramoyl-pentapeptide-transferase [Thiotrichales bacterium]|nr:MAG: phospho-N-acetylmuramoyl-pentapeptide-transferase [Thiotrichales bacterium]
MLMQFSGFNTLLSELQSNVFLRCVLAFVVSLGMACLYPIFIKLLKKLQLRQVIRIYGPKSHLKDKAGTPTFGGVLIIGSIFLSSLLFCNLHDQYIWLVILVTFCFAVLGMWDDIMKISFASSDGIPARYKLAAESLIVIVIVCYLYHILAKQNLLLVVIPIYPDVSISSALLFVSLCYFVLVGSANAVNLTDGLDGLAILPIVLIAGALGVFAYLSSDMTNSYIFHLPYLKYAGDIAVFCASIVGAGLGFLWFNSHPASVFMGDTGALGLGVSLGMIAILLRQELAYFIMAMVFVIETFSVILQLGSFKLRKKRIFRMSPIHHHFELKGLSESKIVVRSWLITAVLVLGVLASLHFGIVAG